MEVLHKGEKGIISLHGTDSAGRRILECGYRYHECSSEKFQGCDRYFGREYFRSYQLRQF